MQLSCQPPSILLGAAQFQCCCSKKKAIVQPGNWLLLYEILRDRQQSAINSI
jgi:hypothetical protein